MSQTAIWRTRLFQSGKMFTLDLQKQLFIRAFLKKEASCKFTYCLYFPTGECKAKAKIVLGVLKTFSLLAYYDMYKTQSLLGFQIFTIFIVLQVWVSEVERRGGDIFLSESEQLSIHEQMPYVVGSSLLPTHPYLTSRRGSHADHGSV
jgi:hypothetical protein